MFQKLFLRTGFIALLASASWACDVHVGEGGFSLDMASGKAEETWTRSYALPAGGRLELINVNGTIEAEATDGVMVEVSARRVARAATDEAAKQLLTTIEMREEKGDTRVRIEVRAPRLSGRAGHDANWTLKIPKGIVVDLRTVNGRVKLTGLEGEIHAQTTNGGVEGVGLASSSIEASSTNGSVNVALAVPLPADGQVNLETVNGGITFSLPTESKAAISAKVVNGSINTADLQIEQGAENTRRRFDGTMNGGGGRITLQTTNGGVRLSGSSTATPTR